MNDLKKLLVCALGFTTLALTACDVEEEDCTDAGVCTTADSGGGEDTDGGVEADAGDDTVYKWVYILDTSADENQAGTPGADICGVAVSCEGSSVNAVSNEYDPGAGDFCSDIGDGCSAKRNDPAAIMDDGGDCEPGSAPTSDYVSLGVDGSISVDFGQDLRGCSVTVVEHLGMDDEGYDVYVCASASTDCLNDNSPLEGSTGGNVSFTVTE